MVDREVGREMGMELLECLFETQVDSDAKGSAESIHTNSFFIINVRVCMKSFFFGKLQRTQKLCCRFSFPCKLSKAIPTYCNSIWP